MYHLDYDEKRAVPSSYTERDMCSLCLYSFRKREHSESPVWYCLFGAAHPRRPCGSEPMGEGWEFRNDDWMSHELWYYCRLVSPWGWCENYNQFGKCGLSESLKVYELKDESR
jgi:hypothetical protein